MSTVTTAPATQRVPVAGVDLDVLRRGPGQPLLLLHGFEHIDPRLPIVDLLARDAEKECGLGRVATTSWRNRARRCCRANRISTCTSRARSRISAPRRAHGQRRRPPGRCPAPSRCRPRRWRSAPAGTTSWVRAPARLRRRPLQPRLTHSSGGCAGSRGTSSTPPKAAGSRRPAWPAPS